MTINDHGITVTIKYGKSYDDTWAVFKGADLQVVRIQITDYFGLDDDVVKDLTLHELVLNATEVAHGTRTAVQALDAVAIPVRKGSPEHPWAGLGDEPRLSDAAIAHRADNAKYLSTEHPFQYVLDAFAAAGDTKELQKVWSTNQAAFKDESVVAAYKARGKELQKK